MEPEESQNLIKAKKFLLERCSQINFYKTEQAVQVLKETKMDEDSLITAYLFVAFAHEHMTKDEVLENFGQNILTMLVSSVKIHRVEYNNEQQEAENIEKLYFALAKDIRVIIIKLALVLAELRNYERYAKEDNEKRARLALDLYAPLAARLGISSIKSELEDLSFKILQPQKYDEIEKEVDKNYNLSQKIIDDLKAYLRDALNSLKIDGEIMGRRKHNYSIYRKIVSKHEDMNDIYDFVALRVLVEDIPQCYALLGKIHSDLTPIPYRFKDYIVTPKSNGYQSLHTTIFWQNKPVEIQIRTFDMHKAAEYGYCAHWMYKEKRIKADSLDEKLGWIRELLDGKDSMSSKEIIDTFKTDIYGGEIFVQSPMGKVVHLPEHSTPIDFAYLIHSEVGNKCVGAKVNGKMLPLTTKLNNGDVVEIITSPNSKGPSRDWLSITKTASAKSKIKQFFKKEMKEDNIKFGKSVFESALKNTGVSSSSLLKKDWVEKLFEKYGFDNFDELYASIGNNTISAKVIVNKLLQLYRAEVKQQQKLQALTSSSRKDTSEKAIIVKGIDNVMVKFASCCNPIPNDEIIGFVSQGRGVIVHRKSCSNVCDYSKERLIEVEWARNSNNEYLVKLQIFAKIKEIALNKLTSILSENKISLVNLFMEQIDGKPVIKISIGIKDITQLTELIKKIQLIDGVSDVRRI